VSPSIGPKRFSRQLQRMLIKSYWDRGIRPAARQYRADLPAMVAAFAAFKASAPCPV
jgi:hypothetical protein